MVCHPDPTDVVNAAKSIAQHRVTIFCGTSTFLRLYTKNRRVHPLMLDSLRIVVAGAEKLSADVREAFKLKFNKDHLRRLRRNRNHAGGERQSAGPARYPLLAGAARWQKRYRGSGPARQQFPDCRSGKRSPSCRPGKMG